GVFTYIENGWIPMSTTNAPSPRRYARGVWTGKKFIVWGGSGANANVVLNDGGMYDPATDTWTAMSTTNAPPGGNRAVMVWTGKRVLVWGISNTGTGVGQNVGGIFDPDANTWESTITTTNAPAYGSYSENVSSSSFWSGTQLFSWSRYAGYMI